MPVPSEFSHSDELWEYCEYKGYCHLPRYIKNVLRVKYLDFPSRLIKLDEDGISMLEEFIRSDTYASSITGHDHPAFNLIDWYGPHYAERPKEFKFNELDRLKLLRVALYVHVQMLSIGPDFYKTPINC